MRAEEMLSDWSLAVKGSLLPELHAHQARALATVSFAMAACGRCDSGRLSAAVPGSAKVPSVRRRVERLVANGRIRPEQAQRQFARAVLGARSGGPLTLTLDETPQGGRDDALRCMKLSVAYRRRAVPLMWVCYPPDAPPGSLPKLIWRLLKRVARVVPAGCGVTLLADRGLGWPLVLDACRLLGWHYVLRLQGATRVRPLDAGDRPDEGEGPDEADRGVERPMSELAPRPGRSWAGAAWVFKKAGWYLTQVTAVWERRCAVPWLLVSDRPAGPARCHAYAKRVGCEQLHRDEKSGGFDWRSSRVRDPAHACRLLLAMALATLLAVSLGADLIKRGWRRRVEATRRRKLSVFQLGLRWFAYALRHGLAVRFRLSLSPP